MINWVLILELATGMLQPVDQYKFREDCLKELEAYYVGTGKVEIDAPIMGGACIPCEEFPEFCI